jgi:rhomboid family GlyGly-CTERM serine protease
MRREERTLRRLRGAAAPLGIAILCIALSLGGDAARELLRYERTALTDLELWRLVTAHFVHLSFGHTMLNVTALAIIAVLLDSVLDSLDWIVATSVAALAIDVGLYWLAPQVAWYVGLSGVLHGILTTGALVLAAARDRFGVIILVLIAAKIAWEQWAGPLPFSELASGGPVVTEAHLYGAFGGVVAFGALHGVRGPRVAPL